MSSASGKLHYKYKTIKGSDGKSHYFGLKGSRAEARIHSGAFGTAYHALKISNSGEFLEDNEKKWLIKEALNKRTGTEFGKEYQYIYQIIEQAQNTGRGVHVPSPIYLAQTTEDAPVELPALAMPLYSQKVSTYLQKLIEDAPLMAERKLCEILLSYLTLQDVHYDLKLACIDRKASDFFFDDEQLVVIDWGGMDTASSALRAKEMQRLGQIVFEWLDGGQMIDPFTQPGNPQGIAQWSVATRILTQELINGAYVNANELRSELETWQALLNQAPFNHLVGMSSETPFPTPKSWAALTNRSAILFADLFSRFASTPAQRQDWFEELRKLLEQRVNAFKEDFQTLEIALREGSFGAVEIEIEKLKQHFKNNPEQLLQISRWNTIYRLLSRADIGQDGVNLYKERAVFIDIIKLLGKPINSGESDEQESLSAGLAKLEPLKPNRTSHEYEMLVGELKGRIAWSESQGLPKTDITGRVKKLTEVWGYFAFIEKFKLDETWSSRFDFIRQEKEKVEGQSLEELLNQRINAIYTQARDYPDESLKIYGDTYRELRAKEQPEPQESRYSVRFLRKVKPALIRIELSDALTDSQYPLDEVRSLIDKLSSEHELLQPIEKDYSLFKERVDEQQAHIERLLDQGSFEGLQGAKAQMGILERAIKEGDFDRTQIDKLNERIDEQQTFFDMWVKRPAKPSWEELSKYARQALVTGVNIFRLIGNSNETEQITGNPLTQLLEPLLQSEEDIQNRVAELRRRIESARQDVEAEKGKVVSELKEQLAQLKDKFEKAHTQSQTWLDTSLRLGGTLEIADWQTIQRLDDHLNNHQPLTLDLLRELSDIESKATSSIVLTICQLLRTRHTELQASSQSEPQELQKVVEAALQTQREQDLYTDLSKIQGLISEWEGIYLSPTATPEEVSDMADVLHTLNTYKEAAKNSKSRWIYNKIIAELKKLFERRIPTPKRKQFKEILSIDDFETGEEIVQQPQPPQKPVASPKQPIQKPPTIQSANKNKERKS
jgi:hypothetical protein